MILPYEAVIIGTSAGAMEALTTILPALPENYPLPVIVAVHLPPDKDSVLAEIFRLRCNVAVKEAEDKEILQASTIYFVVPDYHLLVENDHSLSLSSEEPVLFSRPSIDVLFETAADAYGDKLLAIILTGANHDGSKGLKMVVDAGGTAIVQTPTEAYAPEMPAAALKACPAAHSMSLREIASFLQGVA